MLRNESKAVILKRAKLVHNFNGFPIQGPKTQVCLLGVVLHVLEKYLCLQSLLK